MLLTARQTRLAETIDTHVRQVLAQGGDDEALLLSLADSMPTFKQSARVPHVREPFYGVFDPAERTVYVNDPTNIAGMSAMLDAIIAGRP